MNDMSDVNTFKMNRMANCHNRYQGKYKKVLCVCSAGLLRSPTIASILSAAPYNFNTRAAGSEKEFALIPVDEVLIEWADEIVCAEEEHLESIKELIDKADRKDIKVHCFNLPDVYEYRNKHLVKLIEDKAKEVFGGEING